MELAEKQYNTEVYEDLFYHQYSVGELTYRLSILMGIDNNTAIKNFIAGWMHDEGKRRIPVEILAKEGPLTVEERKIINQHPIYSYQMLKQRQMNNQICLIAKYHHENYDGTGYPEGLKGEEIPLCSRIIRVCDMFDALTSNRPYRELLTYKQALNIMDSGQKDFDPKIYKKFKEMIKEDI